MRDLELLAPARNAQIGIAAIDCGADAVYMAGPSFGARHAAGNPVEDIRTVCDYAHRFGARVFVTVNTIVYDEELGELRVLLRDLVAAGADALIVQDLAVAAIAKQEGLDIPLHASTQCAIQNTDKASMLASAGFSRLILERELSLSRIRSIAAAVDCEIECFVHGALCVCYSGNCYLSQELTGRSANRGACAQPCRSLYDLEDASGKTLVRNKALLSLKDFNLIDRLPDLADAGVTSFKIEGRLKNESYVRNVVRAYSAALDELVSTRPDEYRRASFGRVVRSFTPSLTKTFNRGYTSLFIDGRRGQWACMDAPKGMGEIIGTAGSVEPGRSLTIVPSEDSRGELRLANGDGLSFVNRKGLVEGFRVDTCSGLTVKGSIPSSVFKGAVIWRNLDTAFEKEIAANPGKRMLSATLDVESTVDRQGDALVCVRAEREDGAVLTKEFPVAGCEQARDAERMETMVRSQLSKTAGDYAFSVRKVSLSPAPLLSSALLNSWRREIAELLSERHVAARPLARRDVTLEKITRVHEILVNNFTPSPELYPESYKDNIANSISSEIYGRAVSSPELVGTSGIELMRTRYCVCHELGLCPRQSANSCNPLYLVNQGRRLELRFDCSRCEMTLHKVNK